MRIPVMSIYKSIACCIAISPLNSYLWYYSRIRHKSSQYGIHFNPHSLKAIGSEYNSKLLGCFHLTVNTRVQEIMCLNVTKNHLCDSQVVLFRQSTREHAQKQIMYSKQHIFIMNHDSGFIIGIAIFCQNSNRTYT